MDKRIYITFGIIGFFAAILLIVKMNHTEKCPTLQFTVPAESTVGERVQFADATDGAKNWEWQFGDSSGTSALQSPDYHYDKPGTYQVQLTVNGKCIDFKTITIKPRVELNDAHANIHGPTEAVQVGQEIQFTETSEKANSWQWTFGESGHVDSKEQSPKYTFKKGGSKTVTCIVSGPDFKTTGTFNVTVLEKNAPAVAVTPVNTGPHGEAKKALFINKFTDFLLNNDGAARNKVYIEMRSLVCSTDIMVYKGKKEGMTYVAFCQDFMQNNKLAKNIKNLTVEFDEATDCVKSVKLDYKEK